MFSGVESTLNTGISTIKNAPEALDGFLKSNNILRKIKTFCYQQQVDSVSMRIHLKYYCLNMTHFDDWYYKISERAGMMISPKREKSLTGNIAFKTSTEICAV
jgi:hypothetical protein